MRKDKSTWGQGVELIMRKKKKEYIRSQIQRKTLEQTMDKSNWAFGFAFNHQETNKFWC